MNLVGIALDGKFIVSMCQLVKAIWEDCFGIIICYLQYEALTICHAYGILMNMHDLGYYVYAHAHNVKLKYLDVKGRYIDFGIRADVLGYGNLEEH